ncbi:MBL fold metallo-hydrolase [Myxococcus faecalis]|uniref:MBL fold metallo-hydrolase n=1 Tax=Myxococcus faecalis TaxID=3115646 RepID=UPI0024C9022E|nr:MBL fold metallo-hydrolase [Myxococcus sp. MH1]
MLFRQLFDSESSTYTYLLADPATREAVLIDPVLEQVERDTRLLEELGLKLVVVLETHVHADHVTGAGQLRERLGARVMASAKGAPCVDRQLQHGDVVRVGQLELRVLETPGHTDDSLSFLCDGRLFTGDALLVRGTGRTDFQNGDPGQLYDSITRELFVLPDATEVFPAHDYAGFTSSSVGEEKRHNPRLAGRTRDDFVHFMKSRQIPPPRKLDVAVPANRACGLTAPADSQSPSA